MNALIVSNGGQRCAAGLDGAVRLLAGQTGTATLVQIIPRTPYYGRGLPIWDEWDDLQAESATSAALLHEGARRLAVRSPGLVIRMQSLVGEPQDQILRAAAETGVNVLMLDGCLQSTCSLAAPLAGEAACPPEPRAQIALPSAATTGA